MALSKFATLFGRGPKTVRERHVADELEIGQHNELYHIGGSIFGPGMWSSQHLNAPPAPPQGQINANAAQQAYTANPTPPYYDRVVLGHSPLECKASKAITTVVEQLPMRLAGKINRIDYVCRENVNGPPSHHHFAVTYVNAKVIRFENVDTFPLEEDIARIALECP